jgi:O-antigen/teichoic acid export membrane protein
LINKKSIYWFAVSNALDHSIIGIVLIIIYYHISDKRLRFSWFWLKELWKKGHPYIIPELMGLVLQQSDRIMLRFMCSNSEVGIYASALYIAGLSSFVFNAIIQSFQPQILEEKIKDQKKYEQNMIKLYGIVIYLSLLQIVFVMLFGKYMVHLLYGSDFSDSISILNIVVWYTMFSYMGSVRTVWILAESKQKYLWIISLSGMVINIVLNIVLISSLDGKGAAIATLITQVFTNVILIYLIKPMRNNIKYMLKSINIKNLLTSAK